MNEERDILRRVAELRDMKPTGEATERVVAVAKRQHMRRRIVRWAMTSSVAAVVATGVGIGIGGLIDRPATAAELLGQATQASREYHGWVHNRGIVPGKGEFITHTDTETGTWAEVHREGGEMTVHMYLPAKKEEIRYDSKDGVVRIGEISAELARQRKQIVDGMPWTVGEAVASIPGAKVEEARDGEMEKYEIRLPKDDPKTAMALRRTAYPDRVEIWTDSRTHLIRKASIFVDGKDVINEITYGDPAIHDVYELGVPRDAKVVNVGPAPDVNILLQRLQKRYDEGFGDYVAVETVWQAKTDGTASDKGGTVTLYARSGSSFLSNEYLMGEQKHGRRNARYPALPAGWPAPELDAVLKIIRNEMPDWYMISDGINGWQGNSRGEKQSGPWAKMASDFTAQNTLPGHLWPTRNSLGNIGADAKTGIIVDPARPGLVALYIERSSRGREMQFERSVNLLWIDPAKGDVPVETTYTVYWPDKKDMVQVENHTAYSGWTKAANGSWYPTAWRTVTWGEYGQGMKYTDATEHRLRVWTGIRLGSEWFGEPRAEGVGPATVPATVR
ncbi:MAG TPA: hypothetical protein VFE58_10995 [Tepidisphaeraceae bacterium]|jgi:hypothetical protein|nr:hypothetical protein [Tepidisphaeraceae bacterium]